VGLVGLGRSQHPLVGAGQGDDKVGGGLRGSGQREVAGQWRRCERAATLHVGRALGKGPCAEPAHEPTRSCFLTRFWPTRGSAPSTAQTSPAAPFRPSTGASGSLPGRSTTGGDGDRFIFPAACMKIEQEPRWLRMSTSVGSPSAVAHHRCLRGVSPTSTCSEGSTGLKLMRCVWLSRLA